MNNRDKIIIGLLASFTCLIWGSAFPFTKIGLDYLPPLRLAGYRFMLGGLILMPVLFIKGYDWKELKGQWLYILGFGFIQTFLQYGFFFSGLDLAPSAISSIIIGAGPFFVAILAHFFIAGEKLNLRKSLSILLGISGVVFIALKNDVSVKDYPHFHIGVILLLVGNAIGAVTNIMVVNHKKKLSNTALTSFACFFGGCLLTLLSFIKEPEGNKWIGGLTAEFYGALLWLALIPALGFSIWYYIIKLPQVKVSEVVVWKFLIPVFGVFLSWILLANESPEIYSIIGIVIISISIIILQINPLDLFKKKKPRN